MSVKWMSFFWRDGGTAARWIKGGTFLERGSGFSGK